MVYGAYELVQQMGWSRAFDVATWLGGGSGAPRSRARPDRARAGVGRSAGSRPRSCAYPLRVGVLGSALIVAVAWPALRGYGDRPDNATVHPARLRERCAHRAGDPVGSGGDVVGGGGPATSPAAAHCVIVPPSSVRRRSRLRSNNSNTCSWLTGSMSGSADDSGVVVGHQRDRAERDASLACERRLRVLRHVDDVPAHLPEPLRLGTGREPRSVHDHDRASVVHRETLRCRDVDEQRHADAASYGSASDTCCGPSSEGVVESLDAARRPVDQLVDHHELTRMDRGLERPRRERREQSADPERLHRRDIRPVVDPVRREVVAAPRGVAGTRPGRPRRIRG